jgi:hypothetical protein
MTRNSFVAVLFTIWGNVKFPFVLPVLFGYINNVCVDQLMGTDFGLRTFPIILFSVSF